MLKDHRRGFRNSPEIRRLADLKLNELKAALTEVCAFRVFFHQFRIHLNSVGRVWVHERVSKHFIDTWTMKKALGETQTLRAGCSKAEPKKCHLAADPLPGGAGRPKFNQLGMVTTFSYRSSLVKID